MKPVTNRGQLSGILLKGFKSIEECHLELGALNVLVGCNGAGKSNFISFFRMIQHILSENLQIFVSRQGGPDALLHFGRKNTESLMAILYFDYNGYKITLNPTNDNRMTFEKEAFCWKTRSDFPLGSGHFETQSHKYKARKIYDYVIPYIQKWQVYHFHDTSESSYVKQLQKINDNMYLRPDARNLATFLYLLHQSYNDTYQRIVKTIRLVAPFFSDFNLRPSPLNKDMIELEWIEKGSDFPFKALYLSDGTLRFICLATVLLQPEELQPETILIDEPELGLHPYAINVLASMIKIASKKKQLIITTQSVELLNEFDAEDVIVVDRNNNKSVFNRLKEEDLKEWLDDYSLGDLWKKNLFGGRPAR